MKEGRKPEYLVKIPGDELQKMPCKTKAHDSEDKLDNVQINNPDFNPSTSEHGE